MNFTGNSSTGAPPVLRFLWGDFQASCRRIQMTMELAKEHAAVPSAVLSNAQIEIDLDVIILGCQSFAPFSSPVVKASGVYDPPSDLFSSRSRQNNVEIEAENLCDAIRVSQEDVYSEALILIERIQAEDSHSEGFLGKVGKNWVFFPNCFSQAICFPRFLRSCISLLVDFLSMFHLIPNEAGFYRSFTEIMIPKAIMSLFFLYKSSQSSESFQSLLIPEFFKSALPFFRQMVLSSMITTSTLRILLSYLIHELESVALDAIYRFTKDSRQLSSKLFTIFSDKAMYSDNSVLSLKLFLVNSALIKSFEGVDTKFYDYRFFSTLLKLDEDNEPLIVNLISQFYRNSSNLELLMCAHIAMIADKFACESKEIILKYFDLLLILFEQSKRMTDVVNDESPSKERGSLIMTLALFNLDTFVKRSFLLCEAWKINTPVRVFDQLLDLLIVILSVQEFNSAYTLFFYTLPKYEGFLKSLLSSYSHFQLSQVPQCILLQLLNFLIVMLENNKSIQWITDVILYRLFVLADPTSNTHELRFFTEDYSLKELNSDDKLEIQIDSKLDIVFSSIFDLARVASHQLSYQHISSLEKCIEKVYNLINSMRLQAQLTLMELAKVLLMSNKDLVYYFTLVIPRMTQLFTDWLLLIHQSGESSTEVIEILFVDVIFFIKEAIAASSDVSASLGTQIPIILQEIDKCDVAISEKLILLRLFLSSSRDLMKRACDISLFLSDGYPLLLKIESSHKKLEELLQHILRYLVTQRLTPLFLLLSSSYQFIVQNIPTHIENFGQLVKHLILSGKRKALKHFSRLCKKDFCDSKYDNLREFVLTWHPGARGMDFDTFISLCRAISRMMEVRREPHCNPGIVDLISEELSSYIVKSYVIERIRINQFVNIIGKYSLYCRLHNSNGIVISNFQQLCSVLSDSFSSTTVSDVKLLQSLILIGNRVDNICQVKFKSLISFVLDAMRVFMENKPNESLTVDDDILSRLKSVSNFMLKSIPFNIAEVERLKEAGYSQEIWSPTNRFRNHKERIQFFIQTTYPSINETRLKRKFLQNLKTFKIVLSKYSVNSLTIAGKEVLISELVDENLSLEELKIRKLEVKNLIEKEIIYSSSMTPEVSNMFDNLTESVVEDESTEEYTSEDSNMKEKQNSWLAVVSSWRFVDVIDCFSNSIEGCYSSNGSHAEKPLEIALRVNSLVLSLRNSSDTIEFENIEVLLTDQGALIYKIYGNGHESDTSAVWATFFCHLLREDLVPAIIIPNGFPNAQIFSFIRKHVFSESLSMILSYRANWFDEFCSYYDYLPSKAVGNYDLVLTKMNISKVLQVLGLESDSIILHQPRYRIENQGELDFSGILFRFVMQNMKKDSSPFLNSLSFLGKQIYSYLFSLIENGFSNPVVLSVEFDYTRWKRSIKIQSYLPSQVELFDILVSYIIKKVDEFICTCDLLELYEMNPRQFFELMRFFRKRVEFLNREEKKFHNTSRLYSLIVFRLRKFLSQANFSIDCVHSVDCKLKELVNFQRENSSILLISSFSVINQKRLIRWIFRNEESVWRFRGGRPNYETLEEYIQFLDQFSGNCRKSFPGVVILPSFREPLSEKSLLKLLESDRIIGYCIGEFSSSAELDKDSELNSCSYEFVCAWVDANFNGLHLASDMYLTCMKELYQVGCKTIQFDIVGRSWSRIKHSLVNNYWLYWLSTAINLEKLVIQDEKPSYTIMNFQSRTSEEFIHFKANLRWSLYLLKFVQWIARWISFE